MTEPVHNETCPEVTVVIPVFAASSCIAEAIEAVFAQTYTDFEVVVVNDGSPDTAELEAALRPYQSRIVYLKQENRGPAGARNTGIRHARGRYLAFLDADDRWVPEFLATQMRILSGQPSVDLLYCDSLLFGPSSLSGRRYMEFCPSTGPVNFASLVTEKCAVVTSTVVVRRSAVLEVGLFDETFIRSEDFDLWLRLALAGKSLLYHTAVLGRRSVAPGRLTTDSAALTKAGMSVYQKHRDDPRLTAEMRAQVNSQISRFTANLDLEEGKRCLYNRQYAEARSAIERASLVIKSSKLNWLLMGLRLSPAATRFGSQLVASWWRLRSGRPRPGRADRC